MKKEDGRVAPWKSGHIETTALHENICLYATCWFRYRREPHSPYSTNEVY